MTGVQTCALPICAFEYQHGLGYGDGWHKNQSCKIVPMAAEAYLVRGVHVADTVAACDNAFHFMHTLKAQRNDRVMLGGDLSDYECQWTPPDAKGRPVKRKMHSGGVAQQRTADTTSQRRLARSCGRSCRHCQSCRCTTGPRRLPRVKRC